MNIQKFKRMCRSMLWGEATTIAKLMPTEGDYAVEVSDSKITIESTSEVFSVEKFGQFPSLDTIKHHIKEKPSLPIKKQ